MASFAHALESTDRIYDEDAIIEQYRSIIADRMVKHPMLAQDQHQPTNLAGANSFCFVIGADTQLGIASVSQEWQTELEYCERAVSYINAMRPRPAFVCMCGDLVDMHPDLFQDVGSREWRVLTQRKQFIDFQSTFRRLDPSIPLLCLCGNHDVGNRPTRESIDIYKSFFGDDYFAFWCHGCYFICVNSNIYSDCSNIKEEFELQHAWLEERLIYAREARARKIFLCGHHPWFLFSESETRDEMTGINSFIARGVVQEVPDYYFPIPIMPRQQVLSLCQKYSVDACFSGHYHQNLVTRTSWGMPMIVTGAICNTLLCSDAKDLSNPENVTLGAGVRVVTVDEAISASGFSHRYELI